MLKFGVRNADSICMDASDMHICDQFAVARAEAERRDWIVEDLSFDADGLHMSVRMRDGHVKWFPSLYERLVAKFGPR